MTYSAILISDYLIAKSNGILSPLQILNITYICHGYTLAIKHRPLVDDPIEAWSHGPVIPVLYWQLKSFGDMPVTCLLYSRTPVTDAQRLKEQKDFLDMELYEYRDVLDSVLVRFCALSGRDLTYITHKTGSPWDQCYVHEESHAPIPDHITKKYYEQLV